MKTLPAPMLAHLAGRDSTLVMCVKVTLANGTVYGFASHDADLVIGGITYRAQLGVTPSAFSASADLSPGTGEMAGFFAASGILFADVVAGKFNGATAEVFLVNWADLTMGTIPISEGPLGEIQRRGNAYLFECKDWRDLLTLNIGEATSPGCRVRRLGDARCGVKMTPPVWTATTVYAASHASDAKVGSWVKPGTPNGRYFRCTTAGTSGASEPAWDTTLGATTNDGTVVWTATQARTFSGSVSAVLSTRAWTDSARSEAVSFFKYGIVRWLTGANAGTEWEVRANNGTQIDLFLPIRGGIAAGDTYEIEQGCNRSKATCIAFGNVRNFRGEPDKPSMNALLQYSTR